MKIKHCLNHSVHVVISKSTKPEKKYKAVIDNKKTFHFGSSSHSDYTKHKDDERKKQYLARHKTNEDHSKTVIKTAGFYAANVLWNKPTIEGSISNLNKKYKDVKFTLKKIKY